MRSSTSASWSGGRTLCFSGPGEFAREPKAAGRLERRRRIMTIRRPSSLDEIGYLPVRQSGAGFLLLA